MPEPSLDQKYNIFGQCDESSVLVVKSIARVERNSVDSPVDPVILKKVTVVREGQPIPPHATSAAGTAGTGGLSEIMGISDAASAKIALSAAGSLSTIANVDNFVKNVSNVRGNLGAIQNRLESRLNNLATYQENLTASESRIRDVDMAAEMTKFTKLGILQQAGTSMLAQANQAPQGVLSLLR